MRATMELLTEVGIDGATTNAIAARSGCSKSTLYRRWPSRDALIIEALRQAVQGRPDDIRDVVGLEQELGSILHAGARRAAAVFDSRIFRAVFPTIARELLADGPIGRQFRAEVFQPIRAAARQRLRLAAGHDGIDPTVDQDLVFDLIYGAVLYRILLGEPMSDEVTRGIADLTVAGAGRRPSAGR
jgi:AcrR family transcriptional regulator